MNNPFSEMKEAYSNLKPDEKKQFNVNVYSTVGAALVITLAGIGLTTALKSLEPKQEKMYIIGALKVDSPDCSNVQELASKTGIVDFGIYDAAMVQKRDQNNEVIKGEYVYLPVINGDIKETPSEVFDSYFVYKGDLEEDKIKNAILENNPYSDVYTFDVKLFDNNARGNDSFQFINEKDLENKVEWITYEDSQGQNTR